MSKYKEKIPKDVEECTKDPILRCTPDSRAHLADQTGAPRPKSPRITTRAHISASQRKVEPGKLHLGLAKPQVRPNLDGFPAAQSLAGRLSLSL
jgi:hypothetical protein